jgi:signal transduction histidine kinase
VSSPPPDREPEPPRRARRFPRLGLRHEVLILLPAALVLLVVLSTFTLFSYRSGIARLTEERQGEAVRLARAVAAAAAAQGGRLPSPAELRAWAPGARSVALLDAAGRPLAAAGIGGGGESLGAGETGAASLLAPLGGRPPAAPRAPVAAGPDDRLLPTAVAGFAPLAGGRTVRVDLPAAALAGQRRGLALLTAVVLAVDSALLVLVLVFLRHLLVPYETLLARARQVSEGGAGEADEIEFLLATFERAVTASAGRPGSVEDDIAALERTLAASLQSGLLLLDRAGAVLAVNAVGADLLGVPPPPPSTPLADYLASQPELLALLAAAVAQGAEVSREEATLRRPPGDGGEALTLGLTVHPLRRDDGAARGFLVLFADLTQARRRAEESRIDESLAQLGEMAAGVAHELRNSLATLSGYLTLIERRPDEESIADFLQEIRHETGHLERVLDDFLAFARPGTARPRELGLAALLRRAAADPALDGMPVAVAAASPEAEAARLYGDPQLLERAVRNLLRNAAQAEREAGRAGPVEVRIERTAEGIEVAIEDRGRGLPEAVRERLFQPFASGRPGGVGLGLPLAHRIVALHGGRVRLEDRPGGGTRALIAFPSEAVIEQSCYPT